MAKLKTFGIASLSEFFSYFMIVINTRAYTQARYGWTFATDALFITQTFLVTKWLVEDDSARGFWGYIGFLFGGTLGSLAAIFISKRLYGN